MSGSTRKAAAVRLEIDVGSWSDLSSDVLELIFSKLPELCAIRAGSVCKRWRAVTQTTTFAGFYTRNSKFLGDKIFIFSVGGVKYVMEEQFAGPQRRNFFFKLSDNFSSCPLHNATVAKCPGGDDGGKFVRVSAVEATGGGLHHGLTGSRHTTVWYKTCLLDQRWKKTADMVYFVKDPIVGLIKSSDGFDKVVVAGGVPVQEDENDDLAVSIHDAEDETWAACEHLPLEFRGSSSSIFMMAVVHRGRCFAFDMYSGFVSRLDLESKRWSAVAELRPRGVRLNKLFLASMSQRLYLVGVQNAFDREISIKVWEIVDEFGETMRVGSLLQSSVVLNPQVVAPPTFVRWASSVNQAVSIVASFVVILVVELIIFCHSMARRTILFLEDLILSASANYVHFSHTFAPAAVRPLSIGPDSGSSSRPRIFDVEEDHLLHPQIIHRVFRRDLLSIGAAGSDES